jgi:NAD(P)-dependent dehydrogenase (short-subunit alcohol dehydrogenase family)
MTGRLNGKVAIVTGGASGLGREVVDLISREDAAVVIFDRDETSTHQTAAELAGTGRSIIPFIGDVTDPGDFDTAIELARKNFGGFDILHNNAAIQLEKPFHETTDDEFEWIMATNVRGVFNGCRAAVRDFLAAEQGGSIVNTTSIGAHAGNSFLAVYAATKAAVLGLTYSIASGYATNGIRANCVSPGDMDTPMLQKYLDATGDPAGARSRLQSMYPGKRIAHPREIAQVVLFLASDEASFVNGQCVVADGGLLTSLE